MTPYAFARLNSLNDLLVRVASIDAVEDNEYLTALHDFSNRNSGGLFRNVHEEVIAEVWHTRKSLADYWRENV